MFNKLIKLSVLMKDKFNSVYIYIVWMIIDKCCSNCIINLIMYFL